MAVQAVSCSSDEVDVEVVVELPECTLNGLSFQALCNGKIVFSVSARDS